MGDEVLSVALWRGYVMGRFYARSADSDGAVAVSPAFRMVRWPWEERVSLRRDPDALGALDALRKTLNDAGWQRTPARVGARWYELSFRNSPLSLHVAEPAEPAERAERAEPAVDWPPANGNGHAVGAVAGEIVAALQAGPLASGELCSRIGRPSGIVRGARRELEVAGLVQKAAPPAGRSRRATYWQLSREERREHGQRRDGHRAVRAVV